MIYIYIVGPLFNQAEAKQRIYEGTYLKKQLDLIDTPYQIVNPIELPVNDGAADSIAIYQADYRHQCKANVVFLIFLTVIPAAILHSVSCWRKKAKTEDPSISGIQRSAFEA